MNANKWLMSGARMKTTPIPVQRTVRPHSKRVLTSFEPGKMIPVMAIPLLREDALAGAQFRFAFEMKETVELLMNAVNCRVMTYLVPKTAFDRFDGLDSINKSYEGIPLIEGGAVTPWFETMAAPASGSNAILKKMGIHARPGTTINTEYIEAYNQIWNFRARNRSPDIELRDRLDATLAPAFWLHQNFAHIVPDWDQDAMDGAVPLSISNAVMPVRGLGMLQNAPNTPASVTLREPDGAFHTYSQGYAAVDPRTAWGAGQHPLGVKAKYDAATGWVSDVWAELQDNGITISLANIEMAKKTQAFAKLRQEYNGHSDEYIIDLLMDGISVPEQAWNQPLLLADSNAVFGSSKRYATDAANLTESVVNSLAVVQQTFRTPPVPMGGIVMTVVEVTPEQLFERQQDPYLHAVSVGQLPQFLRDTLDPEKVEIVRNEEIDLDHDTPLATFGYAPLNHKWAKSMPNVGGKFYRPEVDAPFDEDRQRIWAVETQNPVLSKDFYLCTTMHQKPFVVTTGDNFELLARGEAAIRGLTVFGGMLVEANNDYEKVAEEAPTDRIEKD